MTIVVADDDPVNLLLLRRLLEAAGYEVVPVSGGAQALDAVRERVPDLFLLDIMMPGMDGLEVCQRLKQDPRQDRVPVIFISGKDRIDDVVRGFEVGAADYITKPVNRSELLARVRTHVQLYHSMLELERLRQLALDANPLTGLPGNNSVVEVISRAIADRREMCVIYCDIDNFKAFNDAYGFARGDQAITLTARVLKGACEAVCGADHFVGHIGGDDFTLLVPTQRAREVTEAIARSFDEEAPGLYDAADREVGYIVAFGRQKEEQRFDLMTLSMGGVDLSGRAFEHYLEVANLCAEVKKLAKQQPGSGIYFDRRNTRSALT